MLSVLSAKSRALCVITSLALVPQRLPELSWADAYRIERERGTIIATRRRRMVAQRQWLTETYRLRVAYSCLGVGGCVGGLLLPHRIFLFGCKTHPAEEDHVRRE